MTWNSLQIGKILWCWRQLLLRGVEGRHLLIILYDLSDFNAKKFLITWFFRKKIFVTKKCLTERELRWNHLNSWGSIFEVCNIFTGSWGRNFVDRLVEEKCRGLKGKITPRKFIFLNELSFFTIVTEVTEWWRHWDCGTGGFENVYS